MSNNIIKLFIYNFCIFYISCYVLIPLKIKGNENILNLLSSERVNEDNLTLIFYNDIEIGEPKQKLIFIVSPDEYNFYIVTNKNKNSINNNSYYYDFRLSKTININFDEHNMNSNVFYMSEKFHFKNRVINQSYIDEIGVENINLVLYLEKPYFNRFSDFCSNINSYIIFGLKLPDGFDKMEYSLNLIRQLKRKNITKNYRWFIDYNTNSINNDIKTISDYFRDIKLNIGVEPHEIYPNLYKEKNLKLINAKSYNGNINWGFYFNKIYVYQNNEIKDKILFELNNNANIQNDNIEEYLIADIKYNLLFINSPQIFFDSINNNFFNKLIKENKCFKEGNKIEYIYCDNKEEIIDYIKKNFMPIYFKNQELNYEFLLEYKDLFIKSGNKILFLIITQKETKRWIFGIPFLKKYLLTYDYDNRVIGFYKQNNTKYIVKNDDLKNNIIKIILIVFLILIVTLVGFLISKHIYGYNRKKRINELQENYQYEYKNDNQKKINNKNLDNNSGKEKLLEMEKF